MDAPLSCSSCGRRQPPSAFSKRQRGVSASSRRCIECVLSIETAERKAAAAAAAAKPLASALTNVRCSGCHQELPTSSFSRTQLCQKTDANRKCLSCAAGGKSAASEHAALPCAAEEPCAHREMARLKSTKRLRRLLSVAAAKAGVEPPVLAFDRYISRSLLAETQRPPPSGTTSDCYRRGNVDAGLIKDLSRVMDEEGARGIASEMAAASKLAAERVGGTASGATEVVVQERRGMVRLGLASPEEGVAMSKPYVELSKEHYDKLAALHAANAHLSGGSLRSRALCLLLRYDTLGAHGFQCALPPGAFDVLHARLGVSFECFASPLNARHPRFCSAFGSNGDVDSFFGSAGSFFDFSPTEGSFEANPPFVPEVMHAAVKRSEDLLAAAEAAAAALSFAFVVPTWGQLPFHRQLTASAWLRSPPDPASAAPRGALFLDAESHAFVDGAAHAREDPRERLRESSFGTTVAVLQTAAAAERWPVTFELYDALGRAFRDALPTLQDAQARAQKRTSGGDAVAQLFKKRRGGTGGAAS